MPQPSSGLQQLFQDVILLVQEFSEPIRASPLHIYCSALPFAPRDTLLFKMFQHELKSPVVLTVPAISYIPTAISPLASIFALGRHKGHSGAISSLTFSPDGTRIVSGSYDSTLQLWNAVDGVHIATLRGHSGVVYSVAYSPDASRIVSGSWDCTVQLWRSTSGSRIAKLKGHSGAVYSVAFSPDNAHVISGSWDCTVRLWNSTTGTSVVTFTGHSDPVRSVAFSPDGTLIVSGSDDLTVRIWNVATNACIAELKGHSGTIPLVAFPLDNTQVVSFSWDNTVRLWDLTTEACISVIESHSRIDSVAFPPGSKSCVTAGKEVLLWNLNKAATLISTLDEEISTCMPRYFVRDDQWVIMLAGRTLKRVCWLSSACWSGNGRDNLVTASTERRLVLGNDMGRLTIFDFSNLQ